MLLMLYVVGISGTSAWSMVSIPAKFPWLSNKGIVISIRNRTVKDKRLPLLVGWT
jgi:hypothetical protein